MAAGATASQLRVGEELSSDASVGNPITSAPPAPLLPRSAPPDQTGAAPRSAAAGADESRCPILAHRRHHLHPKPHLHKRRRTLCRHARPELEPPTPDEKRGVGYALPPAILRHCLPAGRLLLNDPPPLCLCRN